MSYGAMKCYAKGILTVHVAAGQDLRIYKTVNKQLWSMDFTFCQFSQVDNRKSGNVVPNSFHFYAKWNEYGSGKSSGAFLNWFLPGEV